jgi:glucose/arabinose dehydrogenase
VWVPDSDTSRLLDVDQTRAPSPSADNLSTPWGITLLDADSFLITSLGANALLHVTRDGGVQTLVGDLRSPTGVALDADRVYVANSGSSRRAIEWVSREALLNGEDAVLQPLVRGLQNVSNIVVASDGYLYFAYAIGARGVVGRVEPGDCVDNGGCDNDQVELVLYTDLSAPLAGLTISDDMRIFVHTLFRPEIYWASLIQP